MGEAEKLSQARVAGLREFVDRWAKAGPLLEEIRYAELRGKSEDELRLASLDLLDFWRPGLTDDLGAALVATQVVFARYRERYMNSPSSR